MNCAFSIEALQYATARKVLADSARSQTADFAYARLQRSVEKLKNGYPPRALDLWADKARGWAEGGRDVFVYFISGAKVRNPAAAKALIKRLEK